MPRFSIITVCYNSIDELLKTIASVKEQTFEDFEYILVDGASSDGSVEVIRELAASDERVKFISEKDSGLYEAMNKGVPLASGEYIQFLNAGDVFYEADTLRSVDEFIARYSDEKDGKAGKDAERILYYGNIIYVHPDGTQEVRVYGGACARPIYYATGDCINHQALFASRSCFGADGNDFDYMGLRICADRDWMMRQTKSKAEFVPVGKTLVKYDLSEDSVSVRNKDLLKKEERICLKRHYKAYYPVYLIFDFCRNNKVLANALHKIYKLLFIRR